MRRRHDHEALDLVAVTDGGCVSVALFVVKYRVQDLDRPMRSITRETANARRSIHVLKSEWSHLNQPARLRRWPANILKSARLMRIGSVDVEHMLSGPCRQGAGGR